MGAPGEEPSSAEHIGQRATAGALALVARGAAVRVVAFAGYVAFAAYLGPADFGVLAFGLAIVAVAGLLVDGGLAAALVRREAPPSKEELAAATGFQVLAALPLVALAALVAVPAFGDAGLVVALITAGLPFGALRTAGLVVTERRLRYGPIVVVDIIEQLVFIGLGLTLMIAFGVVGVAVAGLVKAPIGSLVLLWLVPEGRVLPSLHLARLRGLLAFGAQFQGASLLSLGRDQVLNVGLAALGGAAVLGQWSLAYRVMQVPFLIFQALWRVSFPALARLRDAGHGLAGVAERLASTASVMTALVISPLMGAADSAIPLLVGREWRDAASIVSLGLLGLLFSGPVSVASAGALYAAGRAGAVLWSVGVSSLAWLAVTLPLVPVVGATAAAVGWLVGSLVEAMMLTVLVRRVAGANLAPHVFAPGVCGAVAGGFGLVVGRILSPDDWLAMVGGGLSALAICALLLALFRGTETRAALERIGRSLPVGPRSVRRRPALAEPKR